VLPVPLAADDGLPRFRNVVRHTESEISVVLDRDELYGHVRAADPNLQQTTPSSVAAVDCEVSGVLQALYETLGGIGGRTMALDLERTVWNVPVCKLQVHRIDAWLAGHVLDLRTRRRKNYFFCI